ncbi:MAG: hypothetical protein OMM_15311 [Candidatus Magnetoglobus multicellularis str. Araruama]|uniref:Glycosyl transferase family 1 domain-containing protein n=1 Tax=Candidatus Magnetoglobus multicellularis str. Araruama TaxID=890399 RepID=A0A1V1NQF0_9BACT|nr:MAG: hypothetical protein OMM_15311 [Candidatus Magnetoglobus multicellularis str. Araruama]
MKKFSDKIIFTGYIKRSELSKIYYLSDLVVVPSRVNDACPNVVLETQACGIPLVATRRGGIPELVVEGKSALLYDDPDDYTALKKNLDFFLDNPQKAREFGQFGANHVRRNFLWQHTVNRTEALYHQLLKIKGK